jgi:hypothetical protein
MWESQEIIKVMENFDILNCRTLFVVQKGIATTKFGLVIKIG